MRIALAVVSAVALAALPTSAHANQWVLGNVVKAQDYTAYNSDYGILVVLSNESWGSGSTTNGPTNCTAAFRLVVGQQNVTEPMKDRAWSTFLTGLMSGRPVALYVDTGTSPNCYVQIFDIGGTTVP